MKTSALFIVAILTALPGVSRAAEEPAPAAPEPAPALTPPASPDTSRLERPASFGETRELMLHAFRSPSIGLEYRHGYVGLHAGAYTTIIGHARDAESQSSTSWFLKTGLTVYFLPMLRSSGRYSSMFASVSYLRGTNNGWEHAAMGEVGIRVAVWKGLDLRLGVAALVAAGEKVRVNPTPGIGWSFPF